MDVTNKIHAKLIKILKKLKGLGIIQSFKLEINFHQVGESMKKSLIEIDSILKKCLRKIISKPRKAEIRNIITELVRKKNLNDVLSVDEPVENISDQKFKKRSRTDVLVVKYQCDLCEETFNSEKKLIIHKRKHEKSEKYLCERCGKIFYSNKKWLEHQRNYTEQIPVSVKMKNLTLFLKREITENKNDNSNILSEAQRKNKVIYEELIQTEVERLENATQGNKIEIEELKKPDTNFICACGKVFQVLKTLRKHERLKHSVNRIQHKCITCGKCFMEKGKLNRHMLSHNDYQYSCSFCMKEFSRSDTLKRHVSLFHFASKKFFCSFCQKKFSLKYNKDIHEVNVHKNANNRVQCDYCDGKFRNKITLKNHFKTHLENKITCTACRKSFKSRSYLETHVKNKHFGIIPCELNSVTSTSVLCQELIPK